MAVSIVFRAQAAIESNDCSTARRSSGQAAIERSGAAGSLKAQAAMEYLVTYGWALLVLFVVVAYLVASGAFSASSFAAQECVIQPDLSCSPFVLFTDGSTATLKYTLTNGLGFPINVSEINYTTTGIGAIGRRVYGGALPTGTVAQGGRMNFTQAFTDPPLPSVGDFRTIYVSFSYFNCKNAPCSGPYVTSGRISAVVQKQ